MMGLRDAAVTAGMMVVLASASADAAQIYTDQATFLTALTSSTTEGFNTSAGGYTSYGSAFSDPTFTVTASSNNLFTVDPAYYPAYYDWNSGAVLDAERGLLTFTTSGANAIGFNFGNPPGVDSPGSTVTINGIAYGGYAKPGFGFFGIVDAGSPVTVTVDFNGGLGIIDNVTTGISAVPLPASAPMFAAALLGLAGLGYAAKRKGAVATA